MSLADRRGPWGADPYGEIVRVGDRTVYLEPSPKRVRVEVAHTTVADSGRARLLHQPGTPAAWWFPSDDVRMDLFEDVGHLEQDALFGSVELLELQVGSHREPGFARRHPDVPAMRGLVGLDWRRFDRLYEEDELVASEPIDPYHRVDVRDSTRHVRISLDGTVLAESHAPRMVFETTARPRFYLTTEEVRTELLEPSTRRTTCQYKGEGEYFHARVGDRLFEDLVWRYVEPRQDGQRIVGRYSLHHERCRTEVDGRPLHDG